MSGSAFNPAVGIGAVVMGQSTPTNLCIWIVACLLGGSLAGVVFKILTQTEARANPALLERQSPVTGALRS
jgi:glycerol uptake facilitator-like aquaporin